MADVTQLPVYIIGRYKDGGIIDGLKGSVRAATDDAKQQFDSAFKEIDASITRALSKPRNASGSLDLGVGELRASQKAIEARATAAQEAATAMRRAAEAEQDYSRGARLAVAAAEALAVEERNAAAAAREQADAAEQVQNQLNKQASATNAIVLQTRGNTGANNDLAKSNNAVRLALIGSGQQMQDIAISLYGGQKASVVFAQQLPQLAFALSGLEGNANKTYSTIGRFATYMSGPWGLAVGLGVGVIGTLIAELASAGDETEKTSRAQREFIDVMRDAKASWEEVTKAAKDYADQGEKSRQVTILQIQAEAEAAQQRIQNALAIRRELQASLELYQQQIRMGPTGPNGQGQIGALAGATVMESSIKENTAQLQALIAAGNEIKFKAADAIAAIQSDPETKLKTGFQVLRDQAKETIKDVGTLIARTAELNTQEREALKALQATRSARNQQYGREINLSTASSIAKSAGFQVNSGLRSTAKQKELYDAWVAQGKPANNPVAVPGTSAHESGNALDIQYGPGVSVASIRKAYADEGVKLTKILAEKGHFHIEWSTSGADKAVREAEQLARAQQQLQEFGQRSAESIARINERFDEQPRLIDQTSQATRQLDAIIADLTDRKPPGFEQMIADAKEAKATVEDALVRPFREMLEDSERRLQVQTLLSQGRVDEAAAVQEIWRYEDANYKLTEKQKDAVRDLVGEEQRRTRELERQRGLFEAQLDVLDASKRSLTDMFSGRQSNFFKDVGQAFKDLQGKRLFDSLFGDTFKQLEDELRGQSPLGKESSHLAREMATATTATEDLAKSFGEGAAAIRAAIKGGANDNELIESLKDGADVVVKPGAGVTSGPSDDGDDGKKKEVDVSKMSIMELAKRQAEAIVEPFQKTLNDVFGTEFGQMLGGIISGAVAGKLTGGTTGGILGGLKGLVDKGDIFGGESGEVSQALGAAGAGAAMGTQAAGIMKALGIKTSTTGAQIGGAIGSFAGPIGSIVGSVAGGLLGGLFKGNRTANAVLTNGESYTQGGKDKANYESVAGLGDSVLEGLNNIVSDLGGTIGNFMVSIGTRGDEYRVNPNGTSLKLDKGALSFGDDAEAAIAFAIKNAIEDGAIKGMRASTLNIIKAGDDLEKALDDAVTWENAFKELRKYKDPLGAAMDDLDDEFDRLIEISKTAGASAQEMADLEELYGIKRNEIIKEQAEALVGSLTSLYKDLTTGDNGLSLRDRRAAALTDYDALSARVKAGDTTAYDDYADAAQQLLDIERELYGSQQEYFDRLNEVTGLTKTRIDAETNVTSITENRDSPFDSTGAVKSSIDSQTDALTTRLDAVNTNIGTLINLWGEIAAGGGSTTAARLAFTSSF